jgi:hypothetical protein
LEGEKLFKQPIRVIPEENGSLAPQSRINFSKVYTVEHNVKVKNIGKVDRDMLEWVQYYFRISNGT